MFARRFIILIAALLLLSSCAGTKSTAQADSNSILREPDNSPEIHGEVGTLYGASASGH
jgi:ABC-type glycerol-3-phosphate transport system substrate-binding protein